MFNSFISLADFDHLAETALNLDKDSGRLAVTKSCFIACQKFSKKEMFFQRQFWLVVM